VRRHNLLGSPYPLDVVAGGEPSAPRYGTLDADILKWVEAEGRILVTRDIRTMPTPLADHIAGGGAVPGILEVRPGTSIPDILDALQLVAHAGKAEDLADQISFIP
jgi:hypothetical protein